MKFQVLMQNDYPIGIYSSTAEAVKAAAAHYQRVYAYQNRPMSDFHYREYEFLVDAEAR